MRRIACDDESSLLLVAANKWLLNLLLCIATDRFHILDDTEYRNAHADNLDLDYRTSRTPNSLFLLTEKIHSNLLYESKSEENQ